MNNKKNDGKAHIYMKDHEIYVTIDGEALSVLYIISKL